MSITRFFERLNAPLRNSRWSWGSADAKGRTILRAWVDEIRQVNVDNYILIARHTAYQNKPSNAGYRERLRHIEGLKSGCTTFALIVEAKDTNARPRKIKSFDGAALWQLGKVIEIEGDEYAQLVESVPISDFLRLQSS